MSRAFRFIGEGVLRDIINGRVVVHMGRRTDAQGHVLEGEIVREHTLDDAKLEAWVKDGRAEYINVVANVVDKIAGRPSAEAEREAAIHQQTVDHADASARLQAAGDLRTIMSEAVFDDDDRTLAEMELKDVPTPKLRTFLRAAERERDKRLDAAKRAKPAKKEKEPEPPAQPDLGGAGPQGAGPQGDAQ